MLDLVVTSALCGAGTAAVLVRAKEGPAAILREALRRLLSASRTRIFGAESTRATWITGVFDCYLCLSVWTGLAWGLTLELMPDMAAFAGAAAAPALVWAVMPAGLRFSGAVRRTPGGTGCGGCGDTGPAMAVSILGTSADGEKSEPAVGASTGV